MKDYTEKGPIVRGGHWPAADDPTTVKITKSSGWPEGADEWTWELLLSRSREGGTPDLTLACSATVDAKVMSITLSATAAETAKLPPLAANLSYAVAIRSTDGEGEPSYWPVVQGTADVRNAPGEG